MAAARERAACGPSGNLVAAWDGPVHEARAGSEDGTADAAAYYTGLADAHESGGRAAALAYLEGRREPMLTAAGLAPRE